LEKEENKMAKEICKYGVEREFACDDDACFGCEYRKANGKDIICDYGTEWAFVLVDSSYQFDQAMGIFTTTAPAKIVCQCIAKIRKKESYCVDDLITEIERRKYQIERIEPERVNF
jgi:hypothetical protein